MALVQRAITFGRMIKFSHSVFALPFALVAGVIAYQTEQVTLSWVDILLLLICMVNARTAAMGFNRIADRRIDAVNPRTRNREIPSGAVKLSEAVAFTLIAALVFIAASFAINTLCGLLSVPLLVLLLGYSLTKRYTVAAHFVLGLCLGAAPVGVWFALTGSFSWAPILLCMGVALWTAGFDIYYSCQDEAFDKEQGLKSIPARLGVMGSMKTVRVIHALAVACYITFGVATEMGLAFYIGLAGITAILVYEAWLLRNGDLSRINLAFFNLNGYVSILFAVATVIDVFVIRS